MTNEELMAKVNGFLDEIGAINVQKADLKGVMTVDNTNFGGIMPRKAVEDLLNLTFAQNEWLGSLNNVFRTGRSGEVPVLELSGNVSEGVGDTDSTPITRRVGTSNVPYEGKLFRSDWDLHLDDIREAENAGINNFETEVATAFARAIGNDKADAIYNSNTSLDASTSRNRLLRMFDGVQKIAENGNVFDAEGKAFDIGIHDAMIDLLPDVYANDPSLRWLQNRRVQTHYHSKLAALNTNLGDEQKVVRTDKNPAGIPTLIVPQISSQQGPAAIAPTSAADNTTYIQLVLTTLITAGYTTLVADRKFKVTCVPTGFSEIVTGIIDTTLRVNTSGLLGQSTVSTTASDYLVQVYDETDIVLMNPKGITVVHVYDMESYRVFNPKARRWEITTWWRMAPIISNPAAVVKFKRVGVTPIETW